MPSPSRLETLPASAQRSPDGESASKVAETIAQESKRTEFLANEVARALEAWRKGASRRHYSCSGRQSPTASFQAFNPAGCVEEPREARKDYKSFRPLRWACATALG
jgi:hypothetical protein